LTEEQRIMPISTHHPGALGPAARGVQAAVDAVVGFVALPLLWTLEALALSLLPPDARNLPPVLYNALLVLPCLVWLGALAMLARRGRTPACVVLGRRWIDEQGAPSLWGPLGSLSFWLAAATTLYVIGIFWEDWGMVGRVMLSWPPVFAEDGSSLAFGLAGAGLMVLGVALPLYRRGRQRAGVVSVTMRSRATP
jgi:hypothetical protein